MEQIKLNKILEEHKEWLKTGGKKGKFADLSSADLSYADLSSADLRSADLSHADLRYANLRSADLSYTDLRYTDLSYTDLRYADLRSADLRYADLRSANLDFSALPLWCGGLEVNIDDRQAIQLLYHLVKNVQFSKNISAEMKEICNLEVIVKKANEFHRVKECGLLKIKDK